MTLLAGLLGVSGWSYWAVFTYVVLANFFFQVGTLLYEATGACRLTE